MTIESSHNRALVSVRDSGPGIADDECEHVFEKFVQSQRTKVGGGTGLGLAICREIIGLHDGHICAVPTHGRGALVRFALPLCKRPTNDQDAHTGQTVELEPAEAIYVS